MESKRKPVVPFGDSQTGMPPAKNLDLPGRGEHNTAAEEKMDFGPGRRLISVKELARYVCLCPQRVYELVCQRRIPSIKLGGKVLFDIREVERWIEENRRPARDILTARRRRGV